MRSGRIGGMMMAAGMVVLSMLVGPSALGQEFFDAPSQENNYLLEISNSGEPEIHALKIQQARLTSDPAKVLTTPAFTLEGNQARDVAAHGQTTFKLINIGFKNVEDESQCVAFENPKFKTVIESTDNLQTTEFEFELPVQPTGFNRLVDFSSDRSSCVLEFEFNKCKCSVGSCEFSEIFFTVPLPGNCGLPPDDNAISSTDLPPYPTNIDPESSVGVLENPLFGNYVMALLGRIGVSARMVDPLSEVGASLASEVRVLIIPSVGLSLVRDSATFRARLEDYIVAGGSVIVFSQGSGEDWAILPGNLDAFGYTQDMACFTKGARVNVEHPVLSSENTGYADAHMDGFFVNYPPGTEELLVREANGQPAVITYPYGLGRVIATDMYPDYAYWTGQYSQDELNYVRDMITWMLRPEELREYGPGDVVSDYTFEVALPTEAGADGAMAMIEVWDPDRKLLLHSEPVTVNVAPGGAETVSISIPELPYKLGIWHVSYEVMDADGLPLYYEEESLDGRFVVADQGNFQHGPVALIFGVGTGDGENRLDLLKG